MWSPIFVGNALVDVITLVSFLSKLNGIPTLFPYQKKDSSHDSVQWDLDFNGIFTVKSFYLKLVSLASSPIQSFSEEHLPWKII